MSDYLNLKKGQMLFEEGDFPEDMYIVKTGSLSIFINQNGVEKEISKAGPGSLIGEMALFDKKLRSASVRALSEASVVVLPYEQLEKQLDQMPEWVLITMKSMSEKLRQTNKK